MFRNRTFLQILLLCALLIAPSGIFAATESTIAPASPEGNLYIYGSIDKKTAQLLVTEFATVYPGIKVDYVALSEAEVFNRHMRDSAGKKVSADILWSNEINLQAALVKGGYAMRYTPAPDSGILAQANMADIAFVTGFDPIVIAYNKRLVAAGDVPVNRKLLIKAAEKAEWRGKIAACDPEKNDLAFLLLTQDLAYGQSFWGMVSKFGVAGLRLYPDYQTLLERLASGEVLLGYNLPLSSVLEKAKADASIGWRYTTDYTLAMPQSVLIAKSATHPIAARLWVDFLHSAKAQQLLATSDNLYPVATAVAGGEMKKLGGELPAGAALKMVGVGSEVTRFADSGLKKGFLLRWKQKLGLVK